MKNLAISITALLLSCANQSYKDQKPIDSNKNVQTKIDKALDPLEERKCVSFKAEILKDTGRLKNYIIQLFPQDFEGVSANEIESIKHYKSTSIKDYGNAEVYIMHVKNDQLPSVVNPLFYLLVNKEKGNAVLFPFIDLDLIKVKANDEHNWVCGIFKSRDKGYFLIYQYNQNNRFKCVFNSVDSLCSNGVPVYNSSLDCISYKPFTLELQNVDLNDDGLLDLVFSGKVLFFCEGLEIGYGREDRKPVKELSLNIQLIAFQNQQQNIQWQIRDTTLCKNLNN